MIYNNYKLLIIFTFILYSFILFFFFKGIIKAIKLRFAANSVYVYDDMYRILVDNFNQYSKENKLDIELSMELFSVMNTTYTTTSEYGSTIDSLLLRKSKKYDIYCYDPIYIKKYAPHLENLKLHIQKEHMELYSTGNAPKVSIVNDEWVGLVIIKIFYF